MSNLRVAVVGSGVVGLSTAAVVQNEWPNARLTIVADAFNEATNSAVAAGYFIPNVPENAPDADTLSRWIDGSGEHYRRLATGADAGVSGVAMATVLELNANRDSPPPLYNRATFSCHRLQPDELLRHMPHLSEADIGTAHLCVTAFAECRKYLPYLTTKMLANARVQRKTLTSLTELTNSFDFVFNCSGMGAQKLCGDPNMVPLRGQVVRVKAPHLKMAIHGPGVNYILPNLDTVVLGGVSQPNCSDTSPRHEDTVDILRRTERLQPSLRFADIVGVFAGVRPHRRGGARVEVESVGGSTVVHNYGHGANGVGLSWGSAECAVQLAKEVARGGGRGGGGGVLARL